MAGFNSMMIPGSKATTDNTYAEEEILMPKAVKRGEIPALIGIDIEHAPTVVGTTTTGEYSAWHLSTKSEDAIKSIDDDAVVAAGKRTVVLQTAVGQTEENNIERVIFPAPIPITSAKLYIGFHQNKGSAFTAKYRLILVPRYIPGIVQQNNLQAQAQF